METGESGEHSFHIMENEDDNIGYEEVVIEQLTPIEAPIDDDAQDPVGDSLSENVTVNGTKSRTISSSSDTTSSSDGSSSITNENSTNGEATEEVRPIVTSPKTEIDISVKEVASVGTLTVPVSSAPDIQTAAAQPAIVLSSSINLGTQPTAQAKASQIANQIVFVKIMPNSLTTQSMTSSTMSSVSTASPAKTVTAIINPTVTLTPVSSLTPSFKRTLSKTKSSPVLLPPQATTTTTSVTITPPVKCATQTIERTVNLLNNNKILIKSVKSTANVSPVFAPTSTVTDAAGKCDDSHIETKLTTTCSQPTVTPALVESVGVSATCNQAESGEIVAEQDDSPIRKQAVPKIKREFEQLQKTVNESKILMEYVIDRKTRGRRAKKGLRSVTSTPDIDETDSLKSRDGSRSRSISRNESPMEGGRSVSKESDRSVGGSNRNMRSQNVDFSAKQKKFLRNIQKSHESGEDSDDSVNYVDEPEDLFFMDNEDKMDDGGKDELNHEGEKIDEVENSRKIESAAAPKVKTKV